METAIFDFLKIQGPLAIGWVLAAFLIKFILGRYDEDIKSRIELANSLEMLSKAVEDRKEAFARLESIMNRGTQ